MAGVKGRSGGKSPCQDGQRITVTMERSALAAMPKDKSEFIRRAVDLALQCRVKARIVSVPGERYIIQRACAVGQPDWEPLRCAGPFDTPEAAAAWVLSRPFEYSLEGTWE